MKKDRQVKSAGAGAGNNTFKKDVRVHIEVYDSSRDENAGVLEKVMTQIESEPNNYELVSLDKSITPTGAFVCVVIYKEYPNGILDIMQDDLEITIDAEGNNIPDQEAIDGVPEMLDLDDF